MAAIVALGAVAWGAANGKLTTPPTSSKIGGDFELTSHDGERLSNRSLQGTPFVIFFGFTYCPDVCPTSLMDMTNVLKKLGPDADKLRVLFVSVDSERDSPAQLKLYLSNFDPRIVGLTGTPEEIAEIARAYRIVYQKVPTKDGFTYNHSALAYLMGRDGRYVGHISYQEAEDRQVEKLKELVTQFPSGAGPK